MVEQQYFDSETDQEFTGLRCISRGDIVDPVILMHRQRGTLANPRRSPTRPASGICFRLR